MWVWVWVWCGRAVADGAIRFVEMCRRIIERVCTVEGTQVAPARNRADIEALVARRGWVRASVSYRKRPASALCRGDVPAR